MTAQQADQPSLDKRIAGYRSWSLVGHRKNHMAPQIAVLCVQWPKYSLENPHIPRYFSVFVNNVGKATMLEERKGTFPAGTVIVKEKFAGADSKHPELLTVMVKHAKGFDTAHDDWEYEALDGDGCTIKGVTVEHCQNCHQDKSLTDHVYRDYANKRVWK